MEVVDLAVRTNSMAQTPTDLESMLDEFDSKDFEEKLYEFVAFQLHEAKRFSESVAGQLNATNGGHDQFYEMTDTKVRISDTLLRDIAIGEVYISRSAVVVFFSFSRVCNTMAHFIFVLFSW